MDSPVILFDGVCNLCSSSVNFIIDRDKNNNFKFASLQSAYGQSILKKYNLPVSDFNSFILLENNRYYTRSTAALKVVKKFPGLWKILYAFIIIPKFIRDFFYNIVSANRYKWFGKKDSCRIPSPELQEKFLG